MSKTLSGKLTLVLFCLLCVIGLLSLPLILFTTQYYRQEVSQKLHRSLAEHLVKDKDLLQEHQVNETALKDLFHMLMVVNPSIEVYLLDPDGAILAFSAPPGKVKRTQVDLAPVQEFLHQATPFPILGDDPRGADRQKVFSAAPLLRDGTNSPAGYLYVVLGGEEYDSVVQMLQGSYILRLSAWAVVAGVLFAGLSGVLLFHFLTRRLRRLTTTMETFKQQHLMDCVDDSPEPDIHRGDEIDRLRTTFQEMSERILRQMQELKETDTRRRELVANVSHDLRTPLTSLQGYLDTLLLKEGTLSTEEQRQYLEIAVRHSERLGKLVAELFELAKLESKETQLSVEPFSLSELVQDMVQKFRLQAEQKHVTLQVHMQPDLPFVCADIGLVERALENLSENALRYTPQGGEVTVALSPSTIATPSLSEPQTEQITVRVTDTGSGIPQEDVPHIFDRFYRAEKSRHELSGGAGLGLAIAKRILELHGSGLEVASALNMGTTFTFHLPVFHAET